MRLVGFRTLAHSMAMPSPKIWASCVVKDETDIIAECLRSAARWCDAIYVLDNGSGDGTWEKVQRLAGEIPAVVPFKQDPTPFSENFRGQVFEHYRHLSQDGDWWCRLDADEFYIDDPKTFLAAVPLGFDLIWSASFQYYFTEVDRDRWAADPAVFADDAPVEAKCRHFLLNWSEPRFHRYRRDLVWRPGGWPGPLGPSYGKRIRLKHFQYRSPEQISKRLATRKNTESFSHEMVHGWKDWIQAGAPQGLSIEPRETPPWEDRVLDSRLLTFDDGNQAYEVDERLLPRITDL